MTMTKKPSLANIQQITFEKDDDSNHHIDFITACSNKRASNYHIESADRLSTKKIAGKIIPAIATTTSIVSGLSSLELYKIVYGEQIKEYNTVERYRYGSFNLAVQSFGFSESYSAKRVKINDSDYTIWTKVDVEPNKRVIDLVNDWSDVKVIKKQAGQEITENMHMDFLADDNGIFYFNNNDDTDDKLYKPLRKVLHDRFIQLNSTKIDSTNKFYLTMSLERDTDDDTNSLNSDPTFITLRI
jgi:ubiquitin-activating enzyme E1